LYITTYAAKEGNKSKGEQLECKETRNEKKIKREIISEETNIDMR
jgi:hypothetical protein